MIPFLQLTTQFSAIEPDVRAAIDRVLARGWYILGEEGAAFEAEFAAWLGADHAAGVANGTDAIAIALRAAGIGAGDEVIAPANTCVPTVTGIVQAGATPVIADVDAATLTLTADTVAPRITPRTRAVVPVHLYGHPCDMQPILDLAREHGLRIVEDCAQAHGAAYRGRKCGTLGDAAAFSFYPSKNLGAYGDGGAVVTSDPDVDARARQLRNYGQTDRYRHELEGYNSRLDEIQAAILRAKLPHLAEYNAKRRAIVDRYRSGLTGVGVLREAEWATSACHLFPIRTPRRDDLRAHLRERGVATEVHYPVPIHLQAAYRRLGHRPGDFPVAERACNEVLSLPLYPELTPDAVDTVVAAVNAFAA